MKREAYTHPKMLDLAARLDCDRAKAIGHIQLLIDWTADYALQGDVGKWPNGAIARGCEWHGDPEEFIRALIDAGWLDEDPTHRLRLHDWPDHSENWVRAKLSRSGLDFLPEYDSEAILPQSALKSTPELTEVDFSGDSSGLESGLKSTSMATEVDLRADCSGDSSPLENGLKSTSEPSPPYDPTKPNQSKPIQTNPNQTNPNQTNPNRTPPHPPPASRDRPGTDRGGGGGGGDLGQAEAEAEAWQQARALANRHGPRFGSYRPTARDRRRFLQVAYLAANEFGEELLTDALDAMDQERPDKPYAFWISVTRSTLHEAGVDLEQRLRALPVPAELEKPKRGARPP